MNQAITQERWVTAQAAELGYWRSVDLREILRICAEKPEFLYLLGDTVQRELFAGKAVLEIGCGPLGLSVVSFSRHKTALKRLVKAEPLPRLKLSETLLADDRWAAPLMAWVETLADEGDYVQTPGETLDFVDMFDTVITYNVLDHVRDPTSILANAHRALRSGGTLLVGVDCLSALGRWRFEHVTRRTHRDQILVKAHPHSFRPQQVAAMIERAGFTLRDCYGLPDRLRDLIGSHTRPGFVATKV